MKEIWKPIKGYENYQVSNLGRICKGFIKVRDKEGTRERPVLLKLTGNKGGYYRINLSKNGIKKSYLIHRLVAIAFIPNPEPDRFTDINHKDERKWNNAVDNLEWCTNNYNLAYSRTSDKSNVVECKGVDQYSKEGVFIKHYEGVREAARAVTPKGRSIEASKVSIIRICRQQGYEKTCCGYKWKYSE